MAIGANMAAPVGHPLPSQFHHVPSFLLVHVNGLFGHWWNPPVRSKQSSQNSWRKCTIHLHELAAGKRGLSVLSRWTVSCSVSWLVWSCAVWWSFVQSMLCCRVVLLELIVTTGGNVGIWTCFSVMSFILSVVFLLLFLNARKWGEVPGWHRSITFPWNELRWFIKAGSHFIEWGFLS